MVSKREKELNMPVTTEVANAQHVELAYYGVDVLWIGARSTVNIHNQEIADALKGVKDVPVVSRTQSTLI